MLGKYPLTILLLLNCRSLLFTASDRRMPRAGVGVSSAEEDLFAAEANVTVSSAEKDLLAAEASVTMSSAEEDLLAAEASVSSRDTFAFLFLGGGSLSPAEGES